MNMVIYSIIVMEGIEMFSKDIGINYDIILKNKVPILVRDRSWLKLFGDIDDKKFVNCKKELEELIKEENRVNKNLRSLKIKKKKLMDKILEISYEANSNNDNSKVGVLNQIQEEINRINEEIEELIFKSEMLPKEIREANYKLLKETVKYAYSTLKDCEKNLEQTNNSIESLRGELRNLLDKKHDYEEKISTTYRFLHGILGSKEIEKLDKEMY